MTLWSLCGLIHPQNDPQRDIDRKLARDAENLLVVELDTRLVGCVMVGYEGHRGWINYLAVHPEFQRQGIGRLLMTEAETRLRDIGCAKINLQIRTSNASVAEFYRKIGYLVDEVVCMGKRLEVDSPRQAVSSEVSN